VKPAPPRRSKPIRWGIGFLIVGGVVAMATPLVPPLFPFGIVDFWWIAICPPSIMLLGLDNSGSGVAVIGWTLITVVNAAIYFAVGFCLALLSHRFRSGPTSDS
jgi:hypothetical protein